MTEAWQLRTIDSLCSRVTSGGTPARTRSDYYGGQIPWVKTGELLDALIVDTEEKITDLGLAESSAKLLPAGTVLMAMYGATVGALGMLGREATCNQASCAMIADPRRADARWLFYALLNDRSRIITRATGAAQQNLSAASVKQFTYLTPPLAEQQAIAEVLGALDDKIAANTALAATADRYLAALLDEMAAGRGATTLGAVADVNRRTVKPSPDAGLRYVDIASVANGRFDHPDITPWAEAPGRARRGLSAGDTMWSTVRPNRRSHALNLEDDPLLVASTGLAILSPREVGFAYLYEASRRPEFTAYLENVAEGSAYPAVRADRFLDAPIPDLPADQIAAFEGQAAPLRELVASQARESRTLAATRDALLPQLMSGKLRVRDAERLASDAGA
ncbi:restriction endonuclease subunit S [Microbacterium xanthum]|uniref:restriction endonuclease subunit S n=1 Tax=Microbacterium xanthum TaxID=3079794 RepID=UPI002AD34E49|nr:restriction endonuclease subunit S [Microbacterium sp. KSW-48]MDZ8173084.1 restriction endonuclease subunit S [Microbacterium sp. KSW-48]